MKHQKTQCPDNYLLWGALNESEPEQKQESRKLLNEPEDIPLFNQSDVLPVRFLDGDGYSFASNATHNSFNIGGLPFTIISGLNHSDIEVINAFSTTTSAASSIPSTESHQCYGACTSVARGCAFAYLGECKCGAPRLSFAFWRKGTCFPIVKPPSSQPGRQDLTTTSLANGPNSTALSNSANSSGLPPHAVYEISGYYYYASTGDKVACPCNATCVSYGCCASDNGII